MSVGKVDELNSLLTEYYTEYYRDTLGIPGYKNRVKSRINEDDNYIAVIERYKSVIPFFYDNSNNDKVLVNGAGTGGEFVAFSKLGFNVYGIEPNMTANAILKLKCKLYGYNENNVFAGVSEFLPFRDNSFDLVWSWTVLEHVQSVKKSIEEIHRVLRPGGWAFLMMPDYRQFYEGHYKLFIPMFLPKILIKMYLKFKKRPVAFLDWGINYTNEREVRNIVQHLPFEIMNYIHNWSDKWIKNRTFGMSLVYWMTVLTGIKKNQIWILKKQP